MARGCCGEGRCYCALEEGDNVTIEGTGGADNPYVISASGVGGGGPIEEGDIPPEITRDTEMEAAFDAYAHRVYTAAGAEPGYDTLIDLDYNATSGSIPESWMVRARKAVTNVLTKAFWVNEAGQPRVWTVFKDEPALKLFSFAANGSGKVLTVQDPWDVGNLRWAINGKGQVLLGDSENLGGSVWVGDLGDPVPTDLPPLTTTLRRGAGGVEQLLLNPNFQADVDNWFASSDTLVWNSGTGQDGSPGFARLTSGGTGNRNIQGTLIPCTVGTVLSVEGYTRWNTGTPKDMSVMIRFLDSGGAQLENNIGTLVTPGTGAWSKIESLNADAPVGTVNAQIQVRINSAASGDIVDLDNFWVNEGATVDRTPAEPGSVGIWTGTSEVTVLSSSSAVYVTEEELDAAIAGLADVATSGDYADLTGVPVLPIAKSVTKASNQGYTNTTMTNDSALVLNLTPGLYEMELVVAYDATTANDAKFQFTFSGTATCVMTANYPRLAAAPSPATSTHSIDNGTHSLSMSTAFGNNFQNAGGGGAGIPMPMRIMGRVNVTATGNLQLQAAKQANTDTGTDTIVLAGSWLSAVEVINTP